MMTFEDFPLSASHFEILDLYWGNSYNQSIPAVVLRYKTARSTTADPRSISTNFMLRMIAF